MSSLSEASAKQDTDAAEQDPAAPEQVTKMPDADVPDWGDLDSPLQPEMAKEQDPLQPEMAKEQEAAEAEGVSTNAGEESAGDGGGRPSDTASATALALPSPADKSPTTGQSVVLFASLASSGMVLPSNATMMEINRLLENVYGIQGETPRQGFLPISSLPLPFFLPFAFPRPSPTPSRAI